MLGLPMLVAILLLVLFVFGTIRPWTSRTTRPFLKIEPIQSAPKTLASY